MEENNTPAIVEEMAVVNVDKALNDWNTYQQLTRELLNDSDYQDIKGKRFKKKQAWRKYMRAFNISTRIVDKEIIKNDKGRVTEASFTVRAWTPDGRESEGWGNCSRFENRGFNKPNHDIPATAMTRATNRAISDLIGAGEVSAEEMEHENSGKKKPTSTTKKPASSKKPKSTTPKGIDPETVQDAEIETHNMKIHEEVNLSELLGINKELDTWINMFRDSPTTIKQVCEACQDFIGEDKMTLKEFREIKKAMGMDVK